MRTCTHIKSNGIKCGSPALKYHTHCYFHFQWLHRRTRGDYSDLSEGWSTITLPLLETKASIIFAITEIQAGLLTGHIDNKVAKTLLYGIQLAVQLKLAEGELSSNTPESCSELQLELDKDRRLHFRPPQPVCDSCEKADLCASHSDCLHSREQIREFEKIHEPERYAQDRAYEEENMRRWNKAQAELEESKARLAKTDPEGYRQLFGSPITPAPTPATTPAITPAPTPAIAPALDPCHPERSATPSREVAGPFVSSTSAQPSNPLFTSPESFDRLKRRALNEINILVSNS